MLCLWAGGEASTRLCAEAMRTQMHVGHAASASWAQFPSMVRFTSSGCKVVTTKLSKLRFQECSRHCWGHIMQPQRKQPLTLAKRPSISAPYDCGLRCQICSALGEPWLAEHATEAPRVQCTQWACTRTRISSRRSCRRKRTNPPTRCAPKGTFWRVCSAMQPGLCGARQSAACSTVKWLLAT